MAQYKVLQDIEAEDKLLGPLSLRQFIYAVIVVVLGFIAWRLALVQWLLVLPVLPPLIFFALLAAPFGKDQSSEVWLLAKIKFFVFPRRRIWDQSGVTETVKITVPKVVEKHLTKEFDKEEAKSRLKALAATMDTRGWAIKNVSSGYVSPLQQGSSDRLLDLQEAPQEDLAAVKPDADVLDPQGTPLAQSIGSMQNQSEQIHRQAILQKMQSIASQQKSSQAQLPALPATPAMPATKPTASAPKTIPTPTPVTPVAQPAKPAAAAVQQPVTQTPPPAILKEVKSPEPPSELKVVDTTDKDGSDEVVVSLH